MLASRCTASFRSTVPAPQLQPHRCAPCTATAPSRCNRRGPCLCHPRPRGPGIAPRASPAGGAEPSSAPAKPKPAAALLPYELPDTIKEGIEVGNAFAKQQEWATALEVYEKSMTLAGNGTKRFKDRPRGITDGEKAAAQINIACCHARMGDVRAGLVAVGGALESGYENFAQLRSDPDLAALRADPRFEALLERFQPKKASGLLGGIQKMMGL